MTSTGTHYPVTKTMKSSSVSIDVETVSTDTGDLVLIDRKGNFGGWKIPSADPF